jgi:hypothetical protein
MIFFNADWSQRMQRSADGERRAGDRLTKRRSGLVGREPESRSNILAVGRN